MPRHPNAKKSAVQAVIEDRHEKFRRLARQRFKIIRKNMVSLGRLGGTTYVKTPEEIDRLCAALTKEFNYMIEQLRHGVGVEDEDLF